MEEEGEVNLVDLNLRNNKIYYFIILLLVGCMNDTKKEINFGVSEFAYSTDTYDFDSFSNQVLQTAVYGTLVSANASNEIIPFIAESWVSSNDFREWTFKLKDKLEFENGDSINCNSVYWSLKRMAYLIKENQSQDGLLEHLLGFEHLQLNKETEGLQCNNDSIVLKFKSPVKNVLEKLSFGIYSIIHDSSFDKSNGAWINKSKAISSSNYILVDELRNTNFSLKLRENKLSLIGHSNKFKKINLFHTNDYEKLDALVSTSRKKEKFKNFSFEGGPTTGIYFLRFISWEDNKSIFSNKVVREAIRNKFYEKTTNKCNLKPPHNFFPTQDEPNVAKQSSQNVMEICKGKEILIHPLANDESSPYYCFYQMLNETLTELGFLIKEKKISVGPVYEEILSRKSNFSIDLYPSFTSVTGPTSARFMFFAKEGIMLPDPTKNARKQFESETIGFEKLNEVIWNDSILIPLDHYTHGIYFKKEIIDISQFSNRITPIDFNWIGYL